MLGDWETFVFEIQHDPALQKAVEPDREAVAVEDDWRQFTERCDLHSAGVEPIEMHPPRLRSERNQPAEYDISKGATTRAKAMAAAYLARHVAAGENVDAIIAEAETASPSTARLLRECARER